MADLISVAVREQVLWGKAIPGVTQNLFNGFTWRMTTLQNCNSVIACLHFTGITQCVANHWDG